MNLVNNLFVNFAVFILLCKVIKVVLLFERFVTQKFLLIGIGVQHDPGCPER